MLLALHSQALEVLCEHLEADIICHDDLAADRAAGCIAVRCAGVELGQQEACLHVCASWQWHPGVLKQKQAGRVRVTGRHTG